MTNPIVKIQAKFPDTLQLTWILNNICTNKCSYCIPELYAGKNHHYEWDNAKIFVELLLEKYKNIHCNISGGEPTMSPFMIELAKKFYDNGHTAGITSNGVRTVKYFTKLSKYLNYIVFSYHPEYGDANELIEKSKACIGNCKTHISVMMHPHYWDETVEYYEKICEIPYIDAIAVRIHDRDQKDKSTAEYTKEQLNWFEHKNNVVNNLSEFYIDNNPPNLGSNFILQDNTVVNDARPVEFMSKGQIYFKDWSCNAGLESLFVNTHGVVYKANCTIGGSIGSINKPYEVNWPTQPVLCDGRRCDCSPDYNISKYNTNLKLSYEP